MDKVKEGSLYKVIEIDNITLEIKYGYYDDADRYSKYNEPIPVYPNFKETPIYTCEGYPLVTKIQDKCDYFLGKKDVDECYGCKHFTEEDDMIGICSCIENKKK